MNAVIKKSTLSGIILSGLILSSMPAQAASTCVPSANKATLIALIIGSFIAMTRDHKTPNYDLKKLAQVDEILGKEYWENVYNCIMDGLIGATDRDGSLKIKVGDNKISWSPNQKAYGVLGSTLSFAGRSIKEMDKLAGVVIGAFILKEALEKSEDTDSKSLLDIIKSFFVKVQGKKIA